MLLALLLAASEPQPGPIVIRERPFDSLESYAAVVSGTFSSVAQHRADPAYDEAEARIVRIWPERRDGVWLYQEQVIVNRPGLSPGEARRRPYFQFVARVVALAPGVFRRDNYRVADAKAWLLVGPGDARLARLSPTDLQPASCHNRIEAAATGYYVGRTESCANAYKGAVRMESLSLATPELYVNWDRGFDAQGRQIWGPQRGGYVFRRMREAAR